LSKLADRLNTLPYVLAGPILRKVMPKSVTVWITTQIGAVATLTVWDDQSVAQMEGKRRTVAIGKSLHIVAVTAKPLPNKPDLKEGVVYLYDVSFNFDDNRTSNLKLATEDAKLAYLPFTLPSFALPPQDLNSLRLLQGSCRMPHGEGKDAMPMIDDLIAATAANAYARPHQLLLTGDQIYADDVADVLLPLLTDAGDVLLGWTEVLPFLEQPVAATDLPPPCRRATVLRKAGLTSGDMQSHLMSLSEYLCMYLFVWSGVLWPDVLPSVQEIQKLAFSVPFHPREVELIKVFPDRLEEHRKSVAEFAQTLPRVRCALANIPTYMIFDDHEVTDDWNTTRDWCRGVYGKNPLGLRIVQNALVAYALCQHWGNCPEQFDDPSKPGDSLLIQLDTPQPTQPNAFSRKATEYNENSSRFRTLLGVHDDAVLSQQPDNAVFHDDFSLQYHYTVEGLGHQVIVTDTRTWRSFPRGGTQAPDLLKYASDVTKDQFTHQILTTDNLAGRALLVVLTTNAPAVQTIRAVARHAGITRFFAYHPDVYEAWEIPSRKIPSLGFDRLLRTLTNKLLPKDATGQHYGQVILLSGDVHHSFASRLIYRAKTRFEDQQPQPATAVVAQLVASPFKKEDKDTRGFQRDGYTYAPPVAQALTPAFLRHHEPEGYVGWNVPPGTKLDVGKETFLLNEGAQTSKIDFTGPTLDLWREDAENPFHFGYSVHLTRAPDYRYRLDYLTPLRQNLEDLEDAPKILPLTGATLAERKRAAEAYKTANAHYRLHSRHPGMAKIIGVNNFGEITFDWGPGDNKAVRHTLRWHTVLARNFATTYKVSLNPNDSEFPDIKDGSNS